MGIQVASTSWLLWTVLQWTLGCVCLFQFPFSQGIGSRFLRVNYSDGSFISLFLRILHTVLHSDCISLHFHQQCRRVPFSPRCLQHLSFVGFLTVAILTSVRSHLIVALTCISLMICVVHLFMCLWATCISFLEIGGSSAHFLIGLFFWYWAAWAACIFWILILCQLFHLLLFSPILRVIFSPCL